MDLCNQYNFKAKIILEGLSSLKIEAREDMEIKKIAALNHISPLDVYEKIKSVASVAASSQARNSGLTPVDKPVEPTAGK